MQQPPPYATDVVRIARTYRDAVVSGDSRGAERAVRELLGRGVDPTDLYLRVFGPALEVVGSLWQQGAISVADEHLATAITERMMALVRPHFAPKSDASRRPGRASGPPVLLLACVPGETHRVGAQMVADVFSRAGWDVLFLGADVPADDLVRFSASRRPDLIGLSLTVDHNVEGTRDLVSRLHADPATRSIPLLVGGAIFADSPLLAEQLGADLVARSPVEALALANALLEGEDDAELESMMDAQEWRSPGADVPALLATMDAADVPLHSGRSDSADAGFALILNADGRILWANDAALALFGDIDRPLLGRHFASLSDNFSREKVMTLLARAATGEMVSGFEVNHVTPGWGPGILLAAYDAAMLPDRNIVLLGHDRTRLMDSYERLSLANQQLEGMVSVMAADAARLRSRTRHHAESIGRAEARRQSERLMTVALQSSFLGAVPVALPGIEVAYRYHTAIGDAQVGGDFYDVSAVDEDHVAVVVADVSGKGLQAALATVMVKYVVRAYAAEDPTPSRVLSRFNRFVCTQSDLDGFITMFYALVNVRTGRLLWGSAGHEPALVVRGAGGREAGGGNPPSGRPRVERLEQTALVVGALENEIYLDAETRLDPGDVLVAYTDGIVEARGGLDERTPLGLEALEEYLRGACDVPTTPDAEGIASGLYELVTRHSGAQLHDDATLLTIRREVHS